jgi:signal peptidase I
MSFDFPTILVLGTAVTGSVWALDALLWAPGRRRRESTKEPIIVEYSRSFFPIIFAVLILRSFVVEPFRIPSGSMMPTLLIGDFILVNKFAYGLRLPVAHTKFFEIGEPERGDVMVFRFPRDPSIDYIKRVIGLPGDVIGYRDKVIYVNGAPIGQQRLGRYTGVGSGEVMTGASLRLEDLQGVQHEILVREAAPNLSGEFRVPEGHFFMVGDNRDNSNDSRFWGVVPEQNIVGKAFMVWMNWDSKNGGVSWDRIGRSIQ